MDGVSAAASIIAIATLGVQISIKLITIAGQVSTASARISAIGSDVALTAGTLQQLGELMTQKQPDHEPSIFSESALQTTTASAKTCEGIFQELQDELKKASAEIRRSDGLLAKKIHLSRMERAKWPFLQPRMESLRTDLRLAKETLMFMLQVTTLAYSVKTSKLHGATIVLAIDRRS